MYRGRSGPGAPSTSKEVDPVKKFASNTQVVSFRDAAMLLAGPTSGAVPST
jgi:hypothetical protein